MDEEDPAQAALSVADLIRQCVQHGVPNDKDLGQEEEKGPGKFKKWAHKLRKQRASQANVGSASGTPDGKVTNIRKKKHQFVLVLYLTKDISFALQRNSKDPSHWLLSDDESADDDDAPPLRTPPTKAVSLGEESGLENYDNALSDDDSGNQSGQQIFAGQLDDDTASSSSLVNTPASRRRNKKVIIIYFHLCNFLF